MRLFLASQSPRRRQLLEQIGVAFELIELNVPEVLAADESAEHYVSRVAREKARAGLATLNGAENAVVLAADTEVILDDDVFGKPADAENAMEMLRRLSDRNHRVLSAISCVSVHREEFELSVSEVTFDRLSEADIAAYVATGEPMGRAGAYAIQGRAARFIRHLSGSYSGVMGLPLYETAQLLRRFAIR
jgi:septum formation protein